MTRRSKEWMAGFREAISTAADRLANEADRNNDKDPHYASDVSAAEDIVRNTRPPPKKKR
jgi:hypothetical protein